MRAVLVPSFAAWVVVVVGLGCGGTPVAAPSVAAPPVTAAPLVAQPGQPGPRAPERPADPLRTAAGRDVFGLGRDDPAVPGVTPPSSRVIELPSKRKSDYWSPCVRAFVQSQPAVAREALGEALSLYSTTCTTEPVARVEFRVPRASRTPLAQSQLGLIGALAPTTSEVAIRAAYHGEPLRVERLTVIADGVRWSSPKLDFDSDAGDEVTTLPLTRSLVRMMRRAIDARDTLVRFESATGYEDLAVPDELKQELRVMLDALDAINRP